MIRVGGRRQHHRGHVKPFIDKPADLQPESRRPKRGHQLRRAAIHSMAAVEYASAMIQMQNTTRGKDWITSLQSMDPRRQILNFFNDLSLEGVDHFESNGCSDARSPLDVPELLRGFTKSGIFTVWRPTSLDAIRHMIIGKGTGKGLEIKGKSALSGEYSGFVPYLQIHNNEHKEFIETLSSLHHVRVFYPNESSRDTAARILAKLGKSMADGASARNELDKLDHNFLETLHVTKIDDSSSQGVYGLDISEILFWKGYVTQSDITRLPRSKYDTGRRSMPEFQQMNIDTLRSWDEAESPHNEYDPRPVLWHAGCGGKGSEDCNPMCPQGLLMAYEEENGKVTPVVSDFDCFLLGTRGVKYEHELGKQELSMLSWCVEEIGGILATPEETCWTSRWLEAKKRHVNDHGNEASQEMPKFGYADPKSYSIIKGVVNRLKSKGSGAVRHGPECFNYGFPQELDGQYLVISDTFTGVPWRYVSCDELIQILCNKIDEGFTFPLNPKWILCDPPFKKVYDKLLASQKPNVQDSMIIWYPKQIRQRIEEISTQHSQGFTNLNSDTRPSDLSIQSRSDLAEFELRRYTIRLNSSKKLKHDIMSGAISNDKAIFLSHNYVSFGQLETELNRTDNKFDPTALRQKDRPIFPKSLTEPKPSTKMRKYVSFAA